MTNNLPKVGILMGSGSDHDTMKISRDLLLEFDINVEYQVASAHRAPETVAEYSRTAADRGLKVIIAGAGGAAHLPGVIAAQTCLPVIGVPIHTSSFNGMDSLLSIVQMPGGIPVATVAVGKAGAKNAALLAIQILSLSDEGLRDKLENFRKNQTEKSLSVHLPD